MIPTETFEQIVQELDRTDLLNLCYVSPFYREQANRILYRNVFTGRNGIPGQEYTKISQFIRTIRSAPHLALYVQELKFVAPPKARHLSPASKSLAASFIGLRGSKETTDSRPFSSLVNVRKLTVESNELHLPWPEYLNSVSSESLEEVSTSFRISPAFLEFLALHPTITTLTFSFMSTDDIPDTLLIPKTIAPSVSCLTAGSPILPLISSWRNLTHLQLGCGPVKDTTLLISALDSIGPRLVNLMVSSHAGGQWEKDSVIPFAAIAQRTPNITVFSLRSYHLAENSLGIYPFNLTSSHWRKLETLIFIHPRAASDAGDGFKLFPSLKRLLCIDFLGFGKNVVCFRKLSVTNEIERHQSPSDDELDKLCFSLFSLSRGP